MKIPTPLALIAALVLAPITLAFARETNAADLPPDTSLDLFLLIGQSNMAGRGTPEARDKVAPARVWKLDQDKKWAPAIDPLHFDKPSAGVSLGRTFGIVVSEMQPDVQIGLIPCAVGSTSVNRWKKGGELYNNAISRARAAMKRGKLKAILWHQGEADLTKTSAPVYLQRLRQLIADFRVDLKAPDIPFIIGELGRFYKHRNGGSIDDFNKDLRAFAEKERNCVCVSSENLAHRGDNVHFNASGLRGFGRRYAAAYFKLTGITAPAAAPEQATTDDTIATETKGTIVNVWPEGEMPGRGAKEPETDKPARSDGVRRITNISQPTLEIFPAQNQSAPPPAVIVCPGGGFKYLTYSKEGTDVAPWLNEKGITAIVLKHRAPDNRAGALQDLQRAISLARANAKDWNIDPKKIGVLGFSSGGNLAGQASFQFNERTYAANDDTDTQSCRPDFAVLVYPIYMGQESEKLDSEINIVIPPVLVVHSEDDKGYYPGTKRFVESLERIGAPCTALFYKTGRHGYALRSKREARVWPEAFVEWLDKSKLR